MNSFYLGVTFIIMSILRIYKIIEFDQVVLSAFALAAFLASINDTFKAMVFKINNLLKKINSDKNQYIIYPNKEISKLFKKNTVIEELSFKNLAYLCYKLKYFKGIFACIVIILGEGLTLIIYLAIFKANAVSIIVEIIFLILSTCYFKILSLQKFFDFQITFFIVIAPFVSKIVNINVNNVNELLTIWTLAVLFISISLKNDSEI